MTFHPLHWRNLNRKFLKNNEIENFCLLEIVIQKSGDAETAKNYLMLRVYLRCVQ